MPKKNIAKYLCDQLHEAKERYPWSFVKDDDGKPHPVWSGSFAQSVSKVTVGGTIILGSEVNH